MTIPRPSVTSTQSASESFPCGPPLEKRDRDTHFLEMLSPQENPLGYGASENHAVIQANKINLALDLDKLNQEKACVKSLDSGHKESVIKSDQLISEKRGLETPTHSPSNSLLGFLEGKREQNKSFHPQGFSAEQYKSSEGAVCDVHHLAETRTFHSVPNEHTHSQAVKPEVISDQQMVDFTTTGVSLEVQQNGFHEEKNTVAANGFFEHKTSLPTLLEQERDKGQANVKNGEQLDLSDSSPQFRKSSLSSRHSRIPVLAQEVDSASESSSPISAKEKLFLKKAHQTDLVRLLIEKQQKSLLADFSSASDKSLDDKTSPPAIGLADKEVFFIPRTVSDSNVRQSDDGSIASHSLQSRKSKIPRPVSWTSNDQISSASPTPFLPRPPPGKPPIRPGVEAR